MSSRNHLRFLFVDLAIVFAMCVIGWAAFRLGKIEPEIASDEQQSQDLPSIFKECHDVFAEDIEDPERARRGSELLWYDGLLLKAEYLGIADRLQADLPDLDRAVISASASKRQPGLPRRMQDLKNWIEKQRDRTGLERLGSRSRELKERIAGTQPSVTNGSIAIAEDLGALLQEIDWAYERYLSAFREVTNNAGKPLVEAFVAQHLDRARKAVTLLANLAEQARRDGNAVESFLQKQFQSGAAKRTRRQDEIIQAFLESGTPAEFIQRIRTRIEPDGSSSAASLINVPPLQRVRYALLVALAGLGVFLIVDLYSRAAVMPLWMKLVERNTIIKHQQKLTHFERLAAGVAHEIRNPLTTISARLHTIQRKLQEGTPERKDASVIGNEIERINSILKDFIQLARPAPPNLALMTAEPLLKDVSDLMAPQFQHQAVRLECQLQGRAQFNGDYQQLKQVLINLLQNAAESIGREGLIILRARDGTMPLKGIPTKVAIIEVEDNGPGVRPEVQGRLFEAFFSTKKGGTGLGLPISARIIDRHGGTLDFETQVDRGTIFRIVVPAYEKA